MGDGRLSTCTEQAFLIDPAISTYRSNFESLITALLAIFLILICKLLFVPTVMMYFNSTVVYAIASAGLAIVTEIIAKPSMVWRVQNLRQILRALNKKYAEVGVVESENEGKEEKEASIICAALIALLHFQDLTETGASGVVTIGLIFFAFECVCDFSFVCIMDTFFSVPILSVITYENAFSVENVGASIIMAFFFAAM
ncbi:hypothetical protein TrLO_g4746 [Triparma laevis f. longispina]|uniref:Uncharacterized protein n=1 Tax=Triparma laevis f. longispina TaxID=1714387 RepID=A0A9W7FBB4_9STRA|nr:hypothetical protein TrLO_g4746 [Triparma laevis f. longispina]